MADLAAAPAPLAPAPPRVAGYCWWRGRPARRSTGLKPCLALLPLLLLLAAARPGAAADIICENCTEESGQQSGRLAFGMGHALAPGQSFDLRLEFAAAPTAPARTKLDRP